MLKNGKRRVSRAVAMVVVVAGLVACAAGPMAPKSAEETVRQRAQERWEALVAGQWDRAYRLMTPSYRAVIAPNRFGAQFTGGGVAWQGAEVVSVSCAEERCKVRMKVVVRAAMGMGKGELASTHFDETWVREDGQWWMFQEI